jgi:hypothetical protein
MFKESDMSDAEFSHLLLLLNRLCNNRHAVRNSALCVHCLTQSYQSVKQSYQIYFPDDAVSDK